MEIDARLLSPEAFKGLLEEVVTREGTEYGVREFDLAEKVAQLRRQIELGKAKIIFDAETESCNVIAVP